MLEFGKAIAGGKEAIQFTGHSGKPGGKILPSGMPEAGVRRRQPSEQTMVPATEIPFDKKALDRLERLGGSALIARVIDQFLEKVPQRMEAACDCGKAGDLMALGRAINSIKSAASNVGATEVRDMADRIERLAVQGAKDIVLPLLCHFDGMLGQARAWLLREKSTLGSGKDFGWH
jgi:HPt (histidine-containing phosphotransfer) domain-containing protein